MRRNEWSLLTFCPFLPCWLNAYSEYCNHKKRKKKGLDDELALEKRGI